MENINLWEKLKNSKEYIYCFNNKYYIIGSCLCIESKYSINNLYDKFMNNISEFVIENIKVEKKLKECIRLYNELKMEIEKIKEENNTNIALDKILDLNAKLSLNEKKKILKLRELFILFEHLTDMSRIGTDFELSDMNKIKEIYNDINNL